MDRTYQISLNIKTPDDGFEDYGRYELGPDKAFARALFEQLKGDDTVSERSVLYMDLMEVDNGTPLVKAARHCTLDELTDNTSRSPARCSNAMYWKGVI